MRLDCDLTDTEFKPNHIRLTGRVVLGVQCSDEMLKRGKLGWAPTKGGNQKMLETIEWDIDLVLDALAKAK